MGRRQLFDSDEVLLTMMQLFRRQGFHATSLRDLETATGLHPGSLHRTFGNKDEIFRSALDAYIDRVVRRRIAEHLGGVDDPLAGIRSYFTSTFETGLDRDPGCLVTNSAVESYALDELTNRGVRRGLDEIERGLAGAVERAQAAGQIPAARRADRLGLRLLVDYQGVLVLVRSGAEPARLRQVTNDIVTALREKPG
ncbi:TetR/AcrR family transcriptional regulator [Pseudofrankia sp. BMG5.37]|uniref:TetR/AcrR family transcriptional regulator n=1 Tax=Pseudofrankia sp. BMG5.37 TaxID=3050035 RepID=UPI0028957A54|nr:TetR/AcrR family transcriptional regulator [Pseudofrankia sp. BMG5.37]MDT3439958.1 TetR/AcrR family transcriptional regulator [Pseudofrankia sp. BMG5.37]